MKHRLLFVLTFFLFIFFPQKFKAQSIKEDSAFYESGKIYWRSYRNANISGNKGRTVEYFYENGQHKLTQVTDSSYAQEKLLEFWLPDGTQLVKGGAGKYIEAGRDSCIYTIANGKYNGPAEKYKYHSRYKTGIHFWKLYGAGNYENGFKNGNWNFMDTSGYKTATVNYVNDTIRGSCILYYPMTNKIKASGNTENCMKTGSWSVFDENGNILVQCIYENGEKNGNYIEYYSNGKVKAKGQYIQVTRKFKNAVEDPEHPGDYSRIHITITLTNVPAKNGAWYFYDENENLLRTKKYKRKAETPEYLTPAPFRNYYYRADIPFAAIPDCNYY